jgi:putative FmdB family regulatory protein
MPIYEYECNECKTRVEVFASMSDPAPSLRKVLFPASIHYKGSGFYATDYAKKGSGASSSSGSGGSKSESSDSSKSGSSSSSDSAPASTEKPKESSSNASPAISTDK